MFPPRQPSISETYELAMRHFNAGRLTPAEVSFRQILAREPNHADALNMMAVLAHQVRRDDAALAFVEKALAINPKVASYHVNHGVALAGLWRVDEAMAAFRRALDIKPDHFMAMTNLGDLLARRGELDESVVWLERALVITPDYAEALDVLGNVLREQGKYDQAIAAVTRASELKPDAPQPLNNLGNILNEMGRNDEALEMYRKSTRIPPYLPKPLSNLIYIMHMNPATTEEEVRRERTLWNERFVRPLSATILPHANDRNEDRRLRIGYVSPDFRNHSVASFIEPLLGAHDPEAVEVFCYSSVVSPDEVTARLKSSVANWRDISRTGDVPAAEMIRTDRIDILVDLAGHTASNRLRLFARKPAPVQITYLGYPGSTGVETMDYRLTDKWADPPDAQPPEGEEKLLRMDRCFLCYRAPEDSPNVGPSPAKRNGFVTFGMFNLLSKVNREPVKWWSQILNRLPGSKLLLKTRALGSEEARKRLLDQFVEQGVDIARLDVRSWTKSRREHLEMYNEVDIGLDTYPYQGTTTTCESMWMGVPVVTRLGNMHVSRVGSSLLSSVGIGELATPDWEKYVDVAVELAQDPTRLSDMRGGLREKMSTSPLMDAIGHARSVEAAFREAWRRWCRS